MEHKLNEKIMSNTEENLNNFDETVEDTINEKEDTSEVESNNKDDSIGSWPFHHPSAQTQTW